MNQAETEAPLKRTFRGSRDALIQKAIEEPDLSVASLGTLNVFRLLISVVLLGLFFHQIRPAFFRRCESHALFADRVGYLLFAILSGISARERIDGHRSRSVLPKILVDIIAIVTPDARQQRHLQRYRWPVGHLRRRWQPGFADTITRNFGRIRDVRDAGTTDFVAIPGLDAAPNYPAAGIFSGIIFAIALGGAAAGATHSGQRGYGAPVRCRPQEPLGTQSVHRAASCAKASLSSTPKMIFDSSTARRFDLLGSATQVAGRRCDAI